MKGRPPRPTAENCYRAALQAIAVGRPGMGGPMSGTTARELARKVLIEMGDDWTKLGAGSSGNAPGAASVE